MSRIWFIICAILIFFGTTGHTAKLEFWCFFEILKFTQKRKSAPYYKNLFSKLKNKCNFAERRWEVLWIPEN